MVVAQLSLLNQYPMPYVLKILSGSLNGVEYSLSGEETIFHVGPHADLLNGTAERLLGGAENVFYLPADLPAAAFVIRVRTSAEGDQLQLGERSDEQASWEWRSLSCQQPECAGQMYFAVRSTTEAWTSDVTGFAVPCVPATLGAETASAPATTHRTSRPAVILGGLAACALVLSAAFFYWCHQPEARVRSLASILQDAPADYQILAGERDLLYVFAARSSDKAWAERASRRLQRQGDVHLVRDDEARRLEALLLAAGLDVVVVRLRDPARPEIILSGIASERHVDTVRRLLEGQIPWRHQLQVSAMSDQRLISLAREKLRVLGISTRIEPHGTRASIVNDVFLDDAALGAMTAAAAAFHEQWGRRRISIQPQLWDDLLQGRSYRYSPGQLLSVGSGRWGYAGASGQNLQAAP